MLTALLAGAVPADAHGAQTRPGSRTYLCRIDGTHASGDIQPSNAACAAAVALGGKQPLWDWFGVLRSDGGGRTRGYIPDGQLCSGGEPKYAGYDLARSDWPYTSLTSGAEFTVRYNAWAPHPGEFRLYVTKDGYDPTKPLRWDDLEDQPFSVYDQNSPNGNDAENGTPDYQWNVVLPQKTGQHIIYSVWSRSDSQETFYGCSDVRFDGGSGQVFGVGAGATPVGAPDSSSTPATTTAPTPADPGATDAPDAGDATADPSNPATSIPDTPGSDDYGSNMEEGQGTGSESAVPPQPDGAQLDGTQLDGTDADAATRADGTTRADGIGRTGIAAQPGGAQPGTAAQTVGVEQSALAGASADTAAGGPAQTSAGGGVSWTVGLILALLTFGLGFVAALALSYAKRVRRLENRLAGYDYARPQPPWDRLDPVTPPSPTEVADPEGPVEVQASGLLGTTSSRTATPSSPGAEAGYRSNT